MNKRLPFCLLLFASKKPVQEMISPASTHTLAQSGTTALLPAQDAYVRSGKYAGQNFGSDALLSVKGCGESGGYRRYSYLSFSLPAGMFKTAVLRLYGGNMEDSKAIKIDVYNPSAWKESTVTYSARPSHPSTVLGSLTVTGGDSWREVDLTTFLKGKSGSVSLMLKNTSLQNRLVSFSSREGSHPPELVLSNGDLQPPTDTLPGNPDEPPAVDTGTYDHIFTVWFENKSIKEVFNPKVAPFINTLKSDGVSFSHFTVPDHPSYPRYLIVFSGFDQGVKNDNCINGQPFSTPNLYTSLLSAGKTFGQFSEGLPSVGSDVCTSGKYAEKHNPTTVFKNVPASVNQPFSAVDWSDSAAFSSLPACVMITPNLDNDMHDTDVPTGDKWLKGTMGTLIQWCRNPANKSLFVVYFDEGTSSSNLLPVVMVGANLKHGYVVPETVNHYSFTRFIQQHFGGGFIHANVDKAAEIKNIWQ